MNKLIPIIIGLALVASPAFAWDFHIDATAHDASVAIMGAGTGGSDTGFGYSVATTGGIINGNGIVNSHGGGSDIKGGAEIELGGSGASGDLIFATHDLAVHGCCEGCPCPSGYLYDASSAVTITDGSDVHAELEGGAKESGAGQELTVGTRGNPIEAGTVDAHMSSSLTVGDKTTTHLMGAYGQNVWFGAYGKQGFNSESCGVDGFFVSVMGYENSLCGPNNCGTPGCPCA